MTRSQAKTMVPKSETVDRLLLSRSLVAPLRFKPANDRFTVAAHVLAAHDAAELAIAAICSELSVPDISDSRALGLPDYLGKLKEHLHRERDVSGKDYISKLNRVRVNLKHHGITPDTDQWANVAEKTFGHVSTWCRTYLKIEYAELDAADLIHAQSVRDLILAARSQLRAGRFKDCLEALSASISQASLDLLPIGVHISAGYPDAEVALGLSGYGVDSGRYLVLQRLLPTNSLFFGDGPRWEKRKYGHEANWTQANAEFAYEETINLLTRLQEANPYPTVYLYSDVYKDVLVVKKDDPNVVVLRWSHPEGWQETDEQPQFKIGDRVECQAFGSIVESPDIPDPEQCSFPPEGFRRIVAKDALNYDRLKNEGLPPTVIFDGDDVEITAEPRNWMDESISS
jgi:hypothetical protein